MRWGVSVTPRPLFTPGKDPVPIVQEAGWATGSVWTGAENLAPTGIRSSDRPARSHSLYRLSCRTHNHIGILINIHISGNNVLTIAMYNNFFPFSMQIWHLKVKYFKSVLLFPFSCFCLLLIFYFCLLVLVSSLEFVTRLSSQHLNQQEQEQSSSYYSHTHILMFTYLL